MEKWESKDTKTKKLAMRKDHQTRRGGKICCFLQSEPLIPLRTGGAVRLRCAARLALRCHLHINGSPKQALLPLDFGTGNWWWYI